MKKPQRQRKTAAAGWSILDLLTMTEDQALTACLFSVNDRWQAGKTGKVWEAEESYLVYDPAPGHKKPMLCVHLDTVSAGVVTEQDVVKSGQTIHLSKKSACNCLGADDRAGVYIALKILQSPDFKKYSYGFFHGEESGCIGSGLFARQAEKQLIDDTTFFLGLDRKTSNIEQPEIALYGYNCEPLQDFIKTKYSFFEFTQGTITDCQQLAESFDKPCLNFTAGFNNEHTRRESLNLDIMNAVYGVLRETDFTAGVPEYPLTLDLPTWSVFGPWDYTDCFYDDAPAPDTFAEPMICDFCGDHAPLYSTVYGDLVCGNCLYILGDT